MILSDQVTIDAAPERVFLFFEAMEDNYLRWHPDHLVFRWLGERGVKPGNRFHFEERIAGKLLKKTVRFTRVEPGRHVEFTPQWWLMRAFLPRILFRMSPGGGGALVTQELHLRTGPLGAWLNRREFDAVRRHMHEEGINMKRLLEGKGGGAVMR